MPGIRDKSPLPPFAKGGWGGFLAFPCQRGTSYTVNDPVIHRAIELPEDLVAALGIGLEIEDPLGAGSHRDKNGRRIE
jgi:hypothetical protein